MPRRSKPKAASGVIRKPLSATRARIRSTNASYGVCAQRLVEVLDDRDRDAGRLEPFEPLARVEQERRRRPHQDLVGMVVEGDDRRPGVARRRLARRGARAGRRGRGAARRRRRRRRRPDRATARSSSTPWTTCIAAVRRPGRRRAGRRDEDLVRREPAAVGRGDRDEPARRRRAAGSARRRPGRPPAGRTNWPRATAAVSSSVSVTTGKASSPVSSGRRSGSRPAGLSAAAARTSSSGDGVVERERARRGPGQRAEVGRAPDAPRRGRAPSARTYVPAEHVDVEDGDRAVRVGAVPRHEVERVDRDLARRQLDGLAGRAIA